MSEKEKDTNTDLVPLSDMDLEALQMSEQLYNNAGLDPVVDAGLKDYDLKIKGENKLLNRVLGPRESDIRGYGEAVARRVSLAVYALMNRQYGGKVGDLRENILALQEERDRANMRYDDLMGRVVGILGEEYRQLRSDSNEFMGKLTDLMGEDMKASKIDQEALASKLADIDGLRNQIVALTKEKVQAVTDAEAKLVEQQKAHEAKLAETLKAQEAARLEQKADYEKQSKDQKADYESRLAEQKSALETKLAEQQKSYELQLAQQKESLEARIESQRETYEGRLEKQQEKSDAAAEKATAKHEAEVKTLQAKIAELEGKLKASETLAVDRADEIAVLKADYARLKTSVNGLAKLISMNELAATRGEELYTFVLEDSKVPDLVLDGVGKFIDFKKYFGMAAKQGAETMLAAAEKSLKEAMKKPEA